MADKRDYYEVLGVPKTADDEAIKKAYRKMAKKHHPDLHPGDKEAEDRFKELNEAYEVLSDEQKRAQYDQFGFEQPGAGFGGGYSDFGGFGGFEDIFSSFFGGGFGGGAQRSGPMRGEDLHYEISISFKEAAKGCSKELNVTRHETCGVCQGSGCKEGCQPQTCPTCKGTGQVRMTQNTVMGHIQHVQTCRNCGGTGKIIQDPCGKCGGKGQVRTTKRRTVRIPAGIDDGQVIRISGQGELGQRGGPPGDLQVLVRVKPHKYFVRKGTDLYCQVPVSITQAALGTELDVPTLDKPVKYSVPEGTQPGTMFRIKGKGIPSIRTGVKGDLYVEINVEVPKRLDEKQKELLRQFDATITGREYEQKKSFFERMKSVFT